MSYNSIKQANEVLEYYETLILRSEKVKYIAVVDSENGFKIEVGCDIGNNITIDNDISLINAYLGDFPQTKIPGKLPVPSEFKHKLKFYLKNSDCKENSKSNDQMRNESLNKFYVSTSIVEFKNSSRNDSEKSGFKNRQEKTLFIDQINPDTDLNVDIPDPWLIYPYGGLPINSDLEEIGSLGAIFKLLEFPCKLFGLSNWHILTGFNEKLGQPIFSPKNYPYGSQQIERGHLFWANVNTNHEAGIVEFNDPTSDLLSEHFLKEEHNWSLSEPKIGMEVFHFGLTQSKKNNKNSEIPKIHSVNATVRIVDTRFRNSKRIFKNQILVPQYSSGGASGSLMLTKQQDETKAIGLNFASIDGFIVDSNLNTEDIKITYSVANNLNSIFNTSFKKKQEVFINNKDNIITTSFAESFTLENQKMFK